ncbi:D-(-)-3-hydroxybutyrate oligomer hydrolase [Azoarcus sp. L1K30]|uniref:3-hydroxybutyrate oligomer hydrolase family protein n=1 Tax=Azoarcus sp. L1K30 TaxID=2820277 RepID=UPI001B827BC3|nr:3-hydroxybutyrate oligomer hydrolase family protein [Azoarcus sp. L1K30]MBR0566840.1 D-(-)-3-hydroxybutyrate oligomer hydrolase [Azoarcus sp. L1K30]
MELNTGFRKGLLCLMFMQPLAAFAGDAPNRLPEFIRGTVQMHTYDGLTDDLLTAGLGKSGLAGAAPVPVNALAPTASELRRIAIYNNYRALVPTDEGNGYGYFFGPNVDANGVPGAGEGLIAGVEYLAYAGNESGRANVTLMVQIPDSFDPDNPCIVTAPSSGSRGIYGAIGTAGEWGLKHGCAVAYTDKGTGTGAHNLATDRVTAIDGTWEEANLLRKDSQFTARVGDGKRAAFDAAFPNRYAFKHAHSEQNPEEDWGLNVLQSIRFAFYVLNEEFAEPQNKHWKRQRITPENTLVIASSVSNGGGASVRAAEMDRWGLIDGVAVSEPNVNPQPRAFAIVQGNGAPFVDHSRSLFDYTTLINVYQGCASAAPGNLTAPFNFAPSPAACTSLHEKGLLSAQDPSGQANEAQQIINAYGWSTEQNIVQPSHWFLNVAQSIAMTYANAYGKQSVLDNLCDYSLGATDGTGKPMALDPAAEAKLFGTSNGIPPTAGVNLINNAAVGGALENRASTSASSGRADQNLDGALCLRALATGVDPVTGEKLRGNARSVHRQILNSIERIRASGDLRGRPAVFVTGRNDAILPINHTSRAYVGLNQLVEGGSSGLRYYEITNAHHLDALNSLAGLRERFVPLHHYLFEALDLMYAHLRNGTPLPPSQVVHTVPRGAGAPALSAANVPDIAPAPFAADLVTFDGQTLYVPE